MTRYLLPLLFAAGCAATTPPFGLAGDPATPGERRGDEISVCGELFHTGTRVVLWHDPGGYNAYSLRLRFPAEARADPPRGPRRGRRRGLPDEIVRRVARYGWTLPDLQRQVDQFVLHYDVCGTSRQCFKVLQDLRGLSVHFLLDVDGTIYQSLDLEERAWHGTKANDRSIGVEIAHIGAYGRPQHRVLHEWYDSDAQGFYVTFPKWMKETGVRTPDFVTRPARQELITGNVQGQDLWQYDFTEQQYQALAKLTATLTRVFPRIRLDYPRDAHGELRTTVLGPEEFDAFSGILGHYHVQKNKTDPGPAMDWDRLLAEARAVHHGPSSGGSSRGTNHPPGRTTEAER